MYGTYRALMSPPATIPCKCFAAPTGAAHKAAETHLARVRPSRGAQRAHPAQHVLHRQAVQRAGQAVEAGRERQV